MDFNFEALNQAREGKIQAAEFDPSGFQLPDLKGPPAPPPIEVSEQTQQIQKLLDRELKETQQIQKPEKALHPTALKAAPPTTQSIAPQLKKELSQSQSETRSEKLKTHLQGLKQCFHKLSQNPEASESYREQVLKSIAIMKSCYSGEEAPKDIESMQILQPLLKCQYVKWQALKENKAALPPPPEDKILKKLRQQAGSLSPVERAALFQLVLMINKLLPFFKAENEGSKDTKVTECAPPTHSDAAVKTTSATKIQTTEIEQTDFDPLQASRLIMQMRSKLQRTCSPEEKASLQEKLEQLLQQQSLHRQQQQIQALIRNQKSLVMRSQNLKIKAESPRALMAKIKSAQQKSAQDCQFLYKQIKEATPLWEAALRQLARVGLRDAHEVLEREQATGQVWLNQAQLSEENKKPITQWWLSFIEHIKLLQQLSLEMSEQASLLASEKLLAEMQASKEAWQKQRDKIKQLEQAYLKTEDPIQRNQIQKQLWQKYAECLLELPRVNSSSDQTIN